VELSRSDLAADLIETLPAEACRGEDTSHVALPRRMHGEGPAYG